MEDPRCPSATIAPRRNPLSPPDNLPISMVRYLHPPVPASGFLLLHLPPSCPPDVGRLPDACQPSRVAPCASNLAPSTSAPVLGQIRNPCLPPEPVRVRFRPSAACLARYDADRCQHSQAHAGGAGRRNAKFEIELIPHSPFGYPLGVPHRPRTFVPSYSRTQLLEFRSPILPLPPHLGP